MKNTNTRLFALAVAALMFTAALSACEISLISGESGSNKNDGALWGGGELELYPAYIAVPDGYSLYIDWNTSTPNQEIEWRSSDPSVATVDADGLVTAVSFGEAVIIASPKGNPEVSAKCGIFVKEYIEDEDAQNEMLIWEDAPPSLYYRAGVIGIELMSIEVEPVLEQEPGENIPLCLSPEAEIITEASIPSAGQNASVTLLAAGRRPKPKIIWIKKSKLKNKLKDNVIWMIFVEGKSEEVVVGWHITYETLYITYETFSMSATKNGGDSPVGTYYGGAQYYRYNDYAPHYAKYPDHKECYFWCSRRVKDPILGDEWTGVPTSELDTPIEWLIDERMSWEGHYTGKDNSGAFFKITQFDMETDHAYAQREDKKIRDFETPADFIKWFNENYVAPELWFNANVEVKENYVHEVYQPTNLGNNWGKIDSEVINSELSIKIYTDNTVKVRRQGFTGTLAKQILK
ncbi:MAG: Ig-like domain-containing protein [Oscillospiraceae bacterium]|nr:Ig-like domain-containing protein [Oscillospiraceae bacterium]